jgi:hypothetical protein
MRKYVVLALAVLAGSLLVPAATSGPSTTKAT